MNNIKIWCTYHDPQQLIDYNLYDTNILKLFNVNNFDLKEDNINHFNFLLNEIVTYYYVWKNQLKTDYVGFCHYRRHFTDIHYEYIDNEHVQSLWLFKCECKDLKNTFGDPHNENQDLIFECFSKYILHNYNIDLNEKINNNETILLSLNLCYIFTWDTFNEICNFIFGFLDYIGNIINVDWQSIDGLIQIAKFFSNDEIKKHIDNDDYKPFRTLGVIFEFLVGTFIGLKYNTYHFKPFDVGMEGCDYIGPHCIIYHIDDPNYFFKMFKLNVKTGIVGGIYNITNYNGDDLDGDLKYKMLYSLHGFIKNDKISINKFLNLHKNSKIIELKENEYIDCEDSFEFNKGNYIIKQLNNNE